MIVCKENRADVKRKMGIGAEKGKTKSKEEVVHTELAGGRLGAAYRTSMPVIKLSVTRQSVVLKLGLREFRIPLTRILYVQTQKVLFASELRLLHSQPEVPAIIGIVSFNPERLVHLFSSLGIRVDDSAGLAGSWKRYRVGAYVQLVGGLSLLVVGLVCLVALAVWATRAFIVGAASR